MSLRNILASEGIVAATTQKGLDPNSPIKVDCLKGSKSTPTTKKFKNMAAYEKWSDSDDASDYTIQRVYNDADKMAASRYEALAQDLHDKSGMWASDVVQILEKHRIIKPGSLNGWVEEMRATYKTAGNPIMDAMPIVDRMGGEITHMNAGTWATFKNSKTRDKAFEELSARGMRNLLKEGAKDIRFLDPGKTAAKLNTSSSFAQKIENLVPDLMGPGTELSVRMGRGEFSSKAGMQIWIGFPADIFPHGEYGPVWDKENARAQRILEESEKALANYFGLPVHTEGTEDSAIVYTVEL